MVTFFANEEFNCKCGKCGRGYLDMDEGLLIRLSIARGIAGVPFILTSAFRCDEHNKAVGGSLTSSHPKGLAVDIAVNNKTRYSILSGLLMAGFNRIGIGKDFIHADCDPDKTTEVIWLY